MDSPHPLKTLLQLQLASDSLAVLHLPFILSSLNPEVLQPSSHTPKWTTRVNSLIHSKDVGARWAGLCLAQQTSVYTKTLMLECAQSWVTVALPMLSKNETEVILKAAIRLLRTVFTTATDIPEFQRQVATPNVPKFSAALITLVERREEETLKVLAMETLTHLVTLYPNLHRASQASMSSLSLRFLNGSTPKPTPQSLLQSASKLYSALHHTGGKVGAANQWRKSMDETLAFAWGAFLKLRTTFRVQDHGQFAPQASSSNEDPLVSVPLYADRLRAAVVVLEDLLQASNPRPVPFPVGSVVRLCQALISCTRDEKLEGHVDAVAHSMELSVLPKIWSYGCTLLQILARCVQRHLTPHASRLCLHLTRQMEQHSNFVLRLPFLRALHALLSESAIRDPLLASRVARAIIPSLTMLLGTQSDVQEDNVSATAGKGRKGKKRARGYEGDEVFKITKEVILPTYESGEVILFSLRTIRLLLLQGSLSPSVQSLTSRVLLAVYMTIPNIPPSIFSLDPALVGRVYEAVQRICIEAAAGTTSTLSKSLGLVIGASLQNPTSSDVMKELDLQLHPRVPPLVRALPHVESLALFRAEEGEEESSTRHALGVGTIDELRQPQPQENVPPTVAPMIQTKPTSMPTYVQEVPSASSIASQFSAPVAADVSSAGFTGSAQTPSTQDVHPADLQPPSARIELPVFADSRLTAAASTGAAPSLSAKSTVPTPRPEPMVADEDEDDPMPSIDMGSDSDSE